MRPSEPTYSPPFHYFEAVVGEGQDPDGLGAVERVPLDSEAGAEVWVSRYVRS